MPGPVVIYALSDPRNPSVIRYIGQTVRSLAIRASDHVTNAWKHPSLAKSRWIRELIDTHMYPKIWPLEVCDTSNSFARELYWVRFFKPLGLLANGIVKNNPNRFHLLTEEHKQKLRNCKRRPVSVEARLRMSRLRRGRRRTVRQQEQILSLSKLTSKKVRCIETGCVFDSATQAGKSVGSKAAKISLAIKRKGFCKGLSWEYICPAP